MLTPQRWRYAGAVLAVFVALVHLFHPRYGYPRLVLHLQAGTFFDPRPLLFTLSGLAIIAGILLVYNGVARRWVYLLGMVLTGTYLVGYVAWHTVLGHGAFWPYIEPHGHTDQSTIEVLIGHLLADPRELASKLAEIALLVVLAFLYLNDHD